MDSNVSGELGVKNDDKSEGYVGKFDGLNTLVKYTVSNSYTHICLIYV